MVTKLTCIYSICNKKDISYYCDCLKCLFDTCKLKHIYIFFFSLLAYYDYDFSLNNLCISALHLTHWILSLVD